jgi:hypothetical protein
MFDIKEFCRISKHWADERIKLADENRKNGIVDPLNQCVDGILQDWKDGKYKTLRKSQKHKQRKKKT